MIELMLSIITFAVGVEVGWIFALRDEIKWLESHKDECHAAK